MKSFVGLVLVVALVEIASGVTPEFAAKVIETKDKCAKEHNVDDSVVKDLVKHQKVPETDAGKCMLACFMEDMKLLVDGKADQEEMKAHNAQKWEDAAIVEKANGVTEKCVAEVSGEGKNKCDYSHDLIDCMVKHGKEAEIPVPDFLNPKRR